MFDLEALLYYEQKLAEEYEKAGRKQRSRERDLDYEHDFGTFLDLLEEAREVASEFDEPVE